jgi:hypothetical protein
VSWLRSRAWMIYFKPSALAGGSEALHMSLDTETSTPSGHALYIIHVRIRYGYYIFNFCGGSIQVESRLGYCNPELLYSCVSLVSFP